VAKVCVDYDVKRHHIILLGKETLAILNCMCLHINIPSI
jgi:hypothetical protein